MKALIVREKYGSYKKGDRIDDEATIAAILKGPDRGHVIVIDPPAPVSQPPKAK